MQNFAITHLDSSENDTVGFVGTTLQGRGEDVKETDCLIFEDAFNVDERTKC
jgi:hypothetical protein